MSWQLSGCSHSVVADAPVGHCVRYGIPAAIGYPIATLSNGLLFFLRLRAVYGNSRRVTIVGLLLWLGLLGPSFLIIPATLPLVAIGTTAQCTTRDVKAYLAAPVTLSLVYDSLVFFGISWRLCQNNYLRANPGSQSSVRSLFSGKNLPSFSRSLLRDGQQYYL